MSSDTNEITVTDKTKTISSDRLRHSISPITVPIQDLYSIDPVQFKYNNSNGDKFVYGFIAEQLESIIPDIVVKDRDGLPEAIMDQNMHSINCCMIKDLYHKYNTINDKLQQVIVQVSQLTQMMMQQLTQQQNPTFYHSSAIIKFD